MSTPAEICGPWNPGLGTVIPHRLHQRMTIYDPANGIVGADDAQRLAEATGLGSEIIATFRPERLALHHVLIRVVAQLHVPDGPNYADFGVSLRRMVSRIFSQHVAPNMPEIAAAHERLRSEAAAILDSEIAMLSATPSAATASTAKRWWQFRRAAVSPVSRPSREAAARNYVGNYGGHEVTSDVLLTACRQALAMVLGRVLARRGALYVDDALIRRLAVNLVSNSYGCNRIGHAVAPLFDAGVIALGYRRLPLQTEPVVMNCKGASASGKSTIRHHQRNLAIKLGLNWQDFAIISPDYWRKLLIDYSGLAGDYKYAAMLCGHEVEIIDRKLDRLLTENAEAAGLPHLLVDRFRFDSFQSADTTSPGKLLIRFAARVFVFFMVTPPEATVERAWSRALDTGRYKAVQDILYHNIEAYSGIPDLFFYWALRKRKSVHYEFLDNSVSKGQVPRTISFGCDGHLVVEDWKGFANIVQYQHVNLSATGAIGIMSRQLVDAEALSFLRQCCLRLDRVDFIQPGRTEIFATARAGAIEINPELMPTDFPAAELGQVNQTQRPLGNIEAIQRDNTIGASPEIGSSLVSQQSSVP